MLPDFDAVIVGAGLVGSACALGLTRAGCRVALIEAVAAPVAATDDARALVLAPASTAVLNELGLWPRLVAHAHPITTIAISDRGGYGSLRLRAADVGLDALGYACPADRLHYELRMAAQEALGNDLQWATCYQSHRLIDDVLSITLRDHAGGESGVTTSLLVAADGSSSSVRAALGIAVEQYDYAQSALIAEVEVDRPQADTAYEHFTRSGPLALIPRGGNRYVSVQCVAAALADDALAHDEVAYAQMLERRFGGRLGRIKMRSPRRAHALIRQRAQQVTAPRAVVIGNAANTVHPNAAQGLNLGLRDVAGLTARANALFGTAQAVALADYAAARAADHRCTVGFTDWLAQSYRSPLLPLRLGRRLALAVTDLCPSLKRHLILEASGLPALARARP